MRGEAGGAGGAVRRHAQLAAKRVQRLRENDPLCTTMIITPPSVRCIVGADSTTGSAMPTAPTFSKRFYDKFGHDNVTELSQWLNQMDLTYRTQLHELNELNFARFDAKLEQRISEVRAQLREEIAELTAELRQEIAQANAALRKEIAESTTRLLRWIKASRSFVSINCLRPPGNCTTGI